MKKFLILMACCLILIAILRTVSRFSHEPGNAGYSGGRGYDFSVERIISKNSDAYLKLAGDKIIRKGLPGQYVFVNFWASWCEVCRSEENYLKNLSQQLSAERMTMVGIATSDELKEIFKSGKLSRRPYLIGLDGTGLLAAQYGVSYLPQSFILDSKGQLIFHVSGALNPTTVRRVLDLVRSR